MSATNPSEPHVENSGSPAKTNERPSLVRDALAGFLVFLIALPLCLGISLASGFPPMAGLITAIIGGLVVSLFMGAPLTIKGPAAGLIVIALGAVTDLGGGDDAVGYHRALACIVLAGVLQIAFGWFKAGKLADMFPSSVVHGMLAAIGIIICSKQIHFALGVRPTGRGPIDLLLEIPHSLMHLNPAITIIGVVSLVILFGMPMIRHPLAKKIPAPLVVLLVTVPMGMLLGLGAEHESTLLGQSVTLGPSFLVRLPTSLLGSITTPDWSHALTGDSIKYVVMFALVGSIESLLSARAIDQLDPNKGKSDYDRDLLAVGVGNAASGLLGGLPMIAEIVRSKANLDNGARTRWANFAHGAFLLVFVAFLPFVIQLIPIAALAAMLIYTGTRLASPREFVHAWKIGREQLFVFVVTVGVTLATDLLVGVASGMVTKLLVHLFNGAGVRGLFSPVITTRQADDAYVIEMRSAAVFTNYLFLKGRVYAARDATKGTIVLDLSEAPLVDHTTMERLQDLEHELAHEGRTLTVRGVGATHQKLSQHPMAARRKSLVPPPPTAPAA